MSADLDQYSLKSVAPGTSRELKYARSGLASEERNPVSAARPEDLPAMEITSEKRTSTAHNKQAATGAWAAAPCRFDSLRFTFSLLHRWRFRSRPAPRLRAKPETPGKQAKRA